jgi:hypothetical protein
MFDVVSDAHNLAPEITIAREHDQAPVHGERLESHVEGTPQSIADGTGRDQLAGEADKELKSTVAGRRLDRIVLPPRLTVAWRPTSDAQVEAGDLINRLINRMLDRHSTPREDVTGRWHSMTSGASP